MTNPAGTGHDPVQTWQALYLQAPSATPSIAACVAAAFRLADQVWRQAAADPALDAGTRAAVTGEKNWARTALAAYQHLHDTRAYAHLDLPAPLRCWADPNRLRAWLTSRSDLPGFTHTTVAHSWNIDDDFGWDADGVGVRMATLVEQAQHASVYGVPGYSITLRQVTTDDPDADPVVEHQITLLTPAGAALASTPMAADHLADDEASGVDAALAVLSNTAAVVNELLAAEQRLIRTATSAASQPHPPPTAQPSRGFTALDLTAPPAVPAAIEAQTPRPDRHPRR
jgi:hypothetical protein